MNALIFFLLVHSCLRSSGEETAGPRFIRMCSDGIARASKLCLGGGLVNSNDKEKDVTRLSQYAAVTIGPVNLFPVLGAVPAAPSSSSGKAGMDGQSATKGSSKASTSKKAAKAALAAGASPANNVGTTPGGEEPVVAGTQAGSASVTPSAKKTPAFMKGFDAAKVRPSSHLSVC